MARNTVFAVPKGKFVSKGQKVKRQLFVGESSVQQSAQCETCGGSAELNWSCQLCREAQF